MYRTYERRWKHHQHSLNKIYNYTDFYFFVYLDGTETTIMMQLGYNKIALLLFLLGSEYSDAFIPSNIAFSSGSSLAAAPLPSPENSAKALTDYMVKAHEEKLKLVKEIEMKKDSELKVS